MIAEIMLKLLLCLLGCNIEPTSLTDTTGSVAPSPCLVQIKKHIRKHIPQLEFRVGISL